MEGAKFDTIVKALAARRTRRSVLQGMLGGGAALAADRARTTLAVPKPGVEICHLKGNGQYQLITIPASAAQGRLSRGGGYLGSVEHCSTCGDACTKPDACTAPSCDSGVCNAESQCAPIDNCTPACGVNGECATASSCGTSQACCGDSCTSLGTIEQCSTCDDGCFSVDSCTPAMCNDDGCNALSACVVGSECQDDGSCCAETPAGLTCCPPGLSPSATSYQCNQYVCGTIQCNPYTCNCTSEGCQTCFEICPVYCWQTCYDSVCV